MIVKNNLLNYSNFVIYQDTDYFNFSLDSLLLARFAPINKRTTHIIDFCSGNAPIPMIMSTLTKANITGIEIQKKIYDLATRSIDENKLNNQIKMINDDIKNINNYFKPESVDLITCNPPYFKYSEESNINKVMIKTIARHEVTIKLEDFVKEASSILKHGGSLSIIHRTERLIEITSILQKYKLEPKIIQFVHPLENKESNLVLINAVKNANSGLKVLSPIIVHEEDGSYKKEIKDLFEVKDDTK